MYYIVKMKKGTAQKVCEFNGEVAPGSRVIVSIPHYPMANNVYQPEPFYSDEEATVVSKKDKYTGGGHNLGFIKQVLSSNADKYDHPQMKNLTITKMQNGLLSVKALKSGLKLKELDFSIFKDKVILETNAFVDCEITKIKFGKMVDIIESNAFNNSLISKVVDPGKINQSNVYDDYLNTLLLFEEKSCTRAYNYNKADLSMEIFDKIFYLFKGKQNNLALKCMAKYLKYDVSYFKNKYGNLFYLKFADKEVVAEYLAHNCFVNMHSLEDFFNAEQEIKNFFKYNNELFAVDSRTMNLYINKIVWVLDEYCDFEKFKKILGRKKEIIANSIADYCKLSEGNTYNGFSIVKLKNYEVDRINKNVIHFLFDGKNDSISLQIVKIFE